MKRLSMMWRILFFLIAMHAFPARAATYSLPANIGTGAFSSCTLSSGTTYNCSSAVNLGDGDTVNLTSGLTLNITSAGFRAGNNVTINSNGYDFLIISREDVDIGTNFHAAVSIRATGKTINVGGSATIIGNLSASTLNIPSTSTVYGTCSPGNARCTSAPVLFAAYRFDEASWSGVAGEVNDSTGNANHATALNGVTTVATPASGIKKDTCRGADIPTESSTATKSGVQTNVDINSLGNSGTIAFWYKSYAAWNANSAANERTLLDASVGASDQFWLRLKKQGQLRFVLTNASGTALQIDSPSVYTTAANTWVHIAITWSFVSGTQFFSIYRNGVLDVTMSGTTVTSDTGYGTLLIGDTVSGQSSCCSANGVIDEVKIYQRAMSAYQIQTTLMGEEHSCAAPALHHVRLDHGGSGVICTGSLVTVNACSTADAGGTCTAETSGLTGNVITRSSGGAVLATVPFAIAAGSSTATVTVSVATPQTVTFETGGLSVTPSNTWTCWNGSAASCSHVFNNVGFSIVDASSNPVNIGTQVAGKNSDVAPGAQTLYLQAVSTLPSGNCQNIFTNNTTVNIDLASQCNNPTTCAGKQVTITNSLGGATTIASNPNTGVTSYTSTPMRFTTNSRALFKLNYPDAGQIKLYARYTLSPGNDALGNSNSFVVKPDHFTISGVKCTTLDTTNCAPNALPSGNNPAAADAAGGSFIQAGRAFSATVSAKDINNNATPNFGKEIAGEGVKLTHSLVAPSGGISGTLTGTTTLAGGSFLSGTATVTDLAWDEVGIIQLTPSIGDGDYLGAGDVTGTISGNIGRFVPDHFDVAVTQGCSLAGFTYSGQPMAVTLSAKNTTPSVTTNYAGASAFAKPVTLSEVNAVTGSISPASVSASAFSAGVASAAPAFTYSTRTTTPATIRLRAVDTDSVSSASGTEGTASIRSGRARLLNANGSELLNLPVPFRIEYWDGTQWITNSSDSCTTLSSSNFAFAFPAGTTGRPNNLAACETALTVSGSPPAYTLSLTKPGAGNDGWTDVTLNLDSTTAGGKCTSVGGSGGADTPANLPWLQFPWKSTAASNPTARATFGVFRSGPVIHRREMY